MGSFLSKTRVKTQVSSKRNRFDLSCNTITTQDFYRPKCVYTRVLMPRQKIQINMGVTTNLAPLANPFYGSCKIMTRGFFVPYRLLMEGFNDFIEDTPHAYADGTISTPQSVPLVSTETLALLFSSDSRLAVGSAAQPAKYDFAFTGTGTSTPTFYVLTSLGRLFWDILQSLGYKMQTYPRVDTKLSAMPLLAWAKVFYDWYQNPAYGNYFDMARFFKGKKTELSLSDVQSIINNSYRVMYEADYFTSAWDNPVSPNSGGVNIQSPINIPDITVSNKDASRENRVTAGVTEDSTSSRTPVIANKSGSRDGALTPPGSISQYMVMALHKVTDYVKRHQLVGSRLLDRYMADWGIQLDSAKLERSIYLGKSDVYIDVSKVMQTSPNQDAGTSEDNGLGNYAGNGIGNGTDSFQYETDEWGIFMLISYVVPRFSYVDGRSRFMWHTQRFDFFTPAFDNLSVQPILFGELSTGTHISNVNNPENEIFGYINRYAEFCVPQDMLLGDFTFESRNTDKKSWFLKRPYTRMDIQKNSLSRQHNLNFTLADGNDYQNIFVDTTGDFEHFYSIFNFNVRSYMPKKSLFDTYDFEDDGKNMLLQVNGTTLD